MKVPHTNPDPDTDPDCHRSFDKTLLQDTADDGESHRNLDTVNDINKQHNHNLECAPTNLHIKVYDNNGTILLPN